MNTQYYRLSTEKTDSYKTCLITNLTSFIFSTNHDFSHHYWFFSPKLEIYFLIRCGFEFFYTYGRSLTESKGYRVFSCYRKSNPPLHPCIHAVLRLCARAFIRFKYESSLSSHSREDDCFKLTLHKHVADIYPGARENIVFYRSVCRVIRVTESQMR